MQKGPIEDLWRVTLSQIPSLLGRLVYLAGLRDPNTGMYSHLGLALRCNPEEANEAIRISHERGFEQWLLLRLVEQREDCELYWSSLLEDRRLVAQMWTQTETYRTLFPASASAAQRVDFNTHMEIMLEWIRNVYGDAGDDRDAWRRPSPDR